MKKSPSGKYLGDVVEPPPTLSSGEGEEIPLDCKAMEAAGGAMDGVITKPTPVPSVASSKTESDPATSTPLTPHPKSLKSRLDQFLSPHPRFGRTDGRFFSPRGFVGLTNENEPPRSPPPGRFFVALAIILGLLGLALLVAVVVYHTRHLDKLLEELEDKKHTIVPADIHDPAIEPLHPSVASFVHWPLDGHEIIQSKESSEENETDDKQKTEQSHSPKKSPLGKISFPDLKIFLEQKYAWNESNPVNAVITGSFGSLNGTLDLTKIGDTIHSHMRKKRQVASFLDRQTLKSVKQMTKELIDQNNDIVNALRRFNVTVKDLTPHKVGFHGMTNPPVIEYAKTILKKRDSPFVRNNLKKAISTAVARNATDSIDLLVGKREDNVKLIGVLNSIADFLENGPPIYRDVEAKTEIPSYTTAITNGVNIDGTTSSPEFTRSQEKMKLPSNASTTVERKLPDRTESTISVASSTAPTIELTGDPTKNIGSTTPTAELTEGPTNNISSTAPTAELTEGPTKNISSTAPTAELTEGPTNNISSTTPTVELTEGPTKNINSTAPTVKLTKDQTKKSDATYAIPSVQSTLEPVVNSYNNTDAENSPSSSDTKETSKLSPTIDVNIPLIQMGRGRESDLSPFTFSSEVDLNSPERREKKLEIEKVELRENLQSMENATNDSVLARNAVKCHGGRRACRDGLVCLSPELWCDGKVDCPDSSDETFCTCRHRVDQDRLCDGYFDCPNGEDELGCLGCDKDDFNCDHFDRKGQSSCAPMTARCDGIRDCPSGKDELSCSLLADGILVGIPGQLAAVSAAKGVLHHNWRGKWLPVCWTEADIEWATAVCREVVSPNITSSDVKLFRAIPTGKYPGRWISLSDGVKVQDTCEFASYVICPPIVPGTRVPPFSDPLESHWETAAASGTNLDELLNMLAQAAEGIESALSEGRNLNEALEDEGIDPANGETMQALDDLAGSFPRDQRPHDDVSRPPRMVNGRVVGGSQSRPGAWPWVVALYSDGKFTCGGAVLNENWVLTAAHCVSDAEDHYLEVQAGMLRRSDFSPTEQTVQVDKVAVNKKFNLLDLGDDIAMLHLSPPLKLNRWVRPILLPSSPAELENPNKLHITDPGKGYKCTVVGWGATAEYGPTVDNEREVVVPVEPCTSKMDRKENDLCAGAIQGGRDSCQGDSGGPLLCSVPEEPSLWFAAGIVSHGEGCGRPKETGAYTRVSNYVDWINEVLSKNGETGIAYLKYPRPDCPGYHCNAGTTRCIPRKKRCDKNVDCLDADDEENCGWEEHILRSNNETSMLSSGARSSAGYQPYKPTTTNEPVQFKSSNNNADTAKSVDVTNVVNTINEVVASVQQSEAAKHKKLSLPLVPTVVPPVTSYKPTAETGSSYVPTSTSVPSPEETVKPDAEKAGPPAPVGEPAVPPPTEQVNPPPDFPTDGNDLIPSASGAGKNPASGEEAAESSESSSSDSSEEKNPSHGPSAEGSASEEQSQEHSSESKPSHATVKPYHKLGYSDTSGMPKPLLEPPPIPVLPVPTYPTPEPTSEPPYVADFDPNEHFLCANGRQKIARGRYCDGIVDCLDSSDESQCTCRDKLQTMGLPVICDGLMDCFDGSDEEGCALCPPGQVRCGLSHPIKCVPESAECDGVENCPRGEDEEGCLALTDGATVILDRNGFPVVRPEGVVARRKRGIWKAVCGLSRADRASTAWAFDACKDLGYNDFEGYNETSVADMNLAPAVELTIPLVGPAPPPTTPLYSDVPNLSASRCAAITVRCSPHIDGNTDRFLVADGIHAWPWLAELLVDGVSHCSGVLVHPNWVVTSHECIQAARFDIYKNMLTVLMGAPRSELGVLEPFEQLRRADDIRLIPNTDILLVHLAEPFIETRHVRPTGLPDWFSMARRALTCVAVGRGFSGSWESLILQHDTVCPQGEGLGKSCFTPMLPNAGCTTNVTTAPWAGSIVCRARTGWYPAAVYNEPHGRCGLAGTRAYDAVFYSLRNIRSILDGPGVAGVGEPPCAGFRCAEGTCLPAHVACDGVAQCRDGRDENPTLCLALREKCTEGVGEGCACGPTEARCGGIGGCIPLTSWCDGKPDCPDGSDEGTSCTCADLLRAARPHLLCDGRRHCEDRSDEDPLICPCGAGRTLCASTYHCVSTDVVCDGYLDCPNGDDEQKCFTLKPFNAPSVSYNAFGEVMRKTYGIWHDMCAPADSQSQVSGASAACSAIGLKMTGVEPGPRFPDPTVAPVLLVDPFTDFFLTNRSAISVRGDRPLALIEHKILPQHECPALRVTCQ